MVRALLGTPREDAAMGNLLDHYHATEAAQKAHVDQADQDKEKAVEEAASLERDIDTLANTFGKTCTVNLLGPIVRVNHVEDEAKRSLKSRSLTTRMLPMQASITRSRSRTGRSLPFRRTGSTHS